MQILMVDIHIKPESVEAFREATLINAQHSMKEPGVARFDFLQQIDDPTHFLLCEVYHDAPSVGAHKETEHYRVWAAKVADMFAAPRTRSLYQNVHPGDEGW